MLQHDESFPGVALKCFLVVSFLYTNSLSYWVLWQGPHHAFFFEKDHLTVTGVSSMAIPGIINAISPVYCM